MALLPDLETLLLPRLFDLLAKVVEALLIILTIAMLGLMNFLLVKLLFNV